MQRDISVFKNKTFNGDCKVILSKMPDNSVDSIVTDPPYELKFMNKGWDGSGIAYDVDVWKECLRVLKPGGHLLSFGGSRTYHRMACAIEDAGFEIRDGIVELLSSDTAVINFLESLDQAQVEAFFKVIEESQFGGIVEWVYGSGFPKSQNIGKAIDKMQGNEREEYLAPIAKPDSDCWGTPNNNSDGSYEETSYNTNAQKVNVGGGMRKQSKGDSEWEGWGSALKPAHEPIVLARCPLSEKTIAANVLKWGTGGINIDGCRVETNWETDPTKRGWQGRRGDKFDQMPDQYGGVGVEKPEPNSLGRFPANLIHDGSDEVVKGFPQTVSGKLQSHHGTGNNPWVKSSRPAYNSEWGGDSGSAARFFYCAKASKVERNLGLTDKEEVVVDDGRQKSIDNPFQRGKTLRKNDHPTVKPLKLMSYLVRLITPPGGIVLDPFSGSGSTLLGAKQEGFNYIGIELQKGYVEIANCRLCAVEFGENILGKEEQLKIETD